MASQVARGVSLFGSRIRSAVVGQRLPFLGMLVRSARGHGRAAAALTLHTVIRQVRFTGVGALPLVAFIALLIGGTVILQAYAQAVRLGMADMPARILVVVVIRELGPLITAMIVLGRSGTAIAAELATNTVLGEIEALDAMGVDTMHMFVLPRLLGLALASVLLTVYFDAIAFTSGIIAAELLGGVPLAASIQSLKLVLTSVDLGVTVLKAAVFGAGIAFICCHAGLAVRRERPTELPRAVTRAVVVSLLFVFGTSTAVTFLTYR
jgi:phospholipid/cholesterol/gamma-HCH transport system permease protein